MSLAPELNVKLVVETDKKRERINARNSVIYAVNGETLILAQTEPSITSSLLNKEIAVTYLLTKSGRHLRYGFSALVTQLIDQYELMPDQYVRAIAVCKCSESKPYEIRMCYRVGPSSKSGLDASILGRKVNIVDISLGGIKFSYGEGLRLETDKVIEVRLEIAGEIYPVQAKIVRTWRTEQERFRTELRFAGAEFLNVNGKMEHELSRKILDIERESPFFSDKL
ncbi:MAG TPA: PilZ domain-containing protein [Syntrophorhabdales bacterium]|nr:PilZ domain-containing protein [Syntrophorhabdales bacterium]